MIQVRKVLDVCQFRHLHSICMPDDEFPVAIQQHGWLATWDGVQVGYLICDVLPGENAVFVSAVGVVPGARGRGVMGRLVRAAMAYCRRVGYEVAVTYTMDWNDESWRGLQRQGFQYYVPEEPWAGTKGVLYWIRRLQHN